VQLHILQQYDSLDVDDFAVRQLGQRLAEAGFEHLDVLAPEPGGKKKPPGMTGRLSSDGARAG
jgi:hypothetical protein